MFVKTMEQCCLHLNISCVDCFVRDIIVFYPFPNIMLTNFSFQPLCNTRRLTATANRQRQQTHQQEISSSTPSTIMPKGHYDRTKTSKDTSIPSIKDACQQFPNEEAAIAFLVSHGILSKPEDIDCIDCGYHGCRRKSKATPKSLKCNKKSCGKSQSLLVNTLFANSKMPLHQILYIGVFFLFNSPAATVVDQLHCSTRTVNDFYQLFRQMIRKVAEADGAFKVEDHQFDTPVLPAASAEDGGDAATDKKKKKKTTDAEVEAKKEEGCRGRASRVDLASHARY